MEPKSFIMPNTVTIGNRDVGDNHPCFIVVDAGINHNGDINNALKLIDAAREAGCEAVKFQKRTVDEVYSKTELATPRESVYGNTNGDLKYGLEFGTEEYKQIDTHCHNAGGPMWLASCWDEWSVDFMEQFNPPCYKIASAHVTHEPLLKHTRATGKPIILSTGMTDLPRIDKAVEILGTDNLIILHCTSTYPCPEHEINLRCIPMLRERYGVPIGYSGHEKGLATSIAAVAMGACVVERHITLDRSQWGSDQSASVEPQGLTRLVRDIRVVEQAMGDGVKRVYDSELPARNKLRRFEWTYMDRARDAWAAKKEREALGNPSG